MFRYAEVEAALAAIHDIPESGMGAFKGRLIHFQRIGLGPSNPGRGKKIEYTLEDVLIWAFCLQLAEFGIDPKTIQAIYGWASLAISIGLFRKVDGDDVFFLVTPMVMSRALNGDGVEAPVSADQIPEQTVVVRASKLDATQLGRAMVINLSRLRRDVMLKLKTPESA